MLLPWGKHNTRILLRVVDETSRSLISKYHYRQITWFGSKALFQVAPNL